MKKNITLLISILFIMISTINVKALEDKTLEIFLPANSFNYNCQNNLTQRELAILDVFQNGDTIINDKNKEIIREVETGDTYYFEVLPGVTVEDRTIELTQELLESIRQPVMKEVQGYVANGNNKIVAKKLNTTNNVHKVELVQEPSKPQAPIILNNDLFEEAIKGYTKIRFTVKNIECEPITEKIVYDFKVNPNILDLSANSNTILNYLVMILMTSSNSYPIAIRNTSAELSEIVNNSNGKSLFTIGNSLYEFRLVPGLSYEDNITIQLKEEDYIELENRLIKEIEFRFGEEPATKDEVIQVPNTSKMNPAYIYLLSLSLIGVGSIIIYDIYKKKVNNNN